jgi:glyceraldehyde-3-phosphate dehydrogenase (NAD(P))
VVDVVSDYRIKTAVALGIPVFASLADRASEMREAGIPITGRSTIYLNGLT